MKKSESSKQPDIIGQDPAAGRKMRWDWFFLTPLVAACVIAFLRFPLIQNDDHLAFVRFILREGSYPPVTTEIPVSYHSGVHHTIAAVIFSGFEWLGEHSPLKPERGVQSLSLFWALGIIPLVWLTLHRLFRRNPRPRIFAFLVFGTFTGWVSSAVTIDNDMAMAFWGNLALLITVIIMQERGLPSWRMVMLLGLTLGMAVLMKATALCMVIPVMVCFFIRKLAYCEPLRRIWPRVLLIALLAVIFAAPNCIRCYRETGSFTYHPYKNGKVPVRTQKPVNPAEQFDCLSFRFPSILKKPFELDPETRDEDRTAADWSFWSVLYMTHWGLPSYLPDDPNPWAASALYLLAFPLTLCGLIGLFVAGVKTPRDPAWCPVIGWPLIGIIIMLAGKLSKIPFDHSRYLGYSTAAQVALLALGFRFVMTRRPYMRMVLSVLIGLQVIVFWWLLLSGPFYSFHPIWPDLSAL